MELVNFYIDFLIKGKLCPKSGAIACMRYATLTDLANIEGGTITPYVSRYQMIEFQDAVLCYQDIKNSPLYKALNEID